MNFDELDGLVVRKGLSQIPKDRLRHLKKFIADNPGKILLDGSIYSEEEECG